MASQLNIKDAETIASARRLARRRGTSVTAAIRDLLRAEEERLGPDTGRMLTAEEQADVDAAMAIVAITAPRLRASGVTMENYDKGINDYLYEPGFKG